MLYCDLDGVLADFNNKIYELTGKYPPELSRTKLWTTVENTPDYWASLQKMPDADVLLDYLKNIPYQILTGLPEQGYQKAEIEKREWVNRYISPEMKMICCLGKEKTRYCQKGDVLIDDYAPNIERWNEAGGIGILHTDAYSTIMQLKKAGF